MKIKQVSMIDVQEWDGLVEQTYGRKYSFQQQDGCQGRGTYEIEVPCYEGYDFVATTVPENVNDPQMGVSFEAWLARDPKAPIEDGGTRHLDLWWYRNFYPAIEAVANDLHAKGLLPAGKYTINIDW